MLVDAHLHLPAYVDREAPLRLAQATSMCLISCTVNDLEARENMAIRSQRPMNVRCFVGVHPSDATRDLPSTRLSPYLKDCDGIGEVGLDEKYSPTTDGSPQMVSFLDQLGVAEKLGKPVQVHSRGSEQRCLDVLGTFNLPAVMMQWFEGEAHVGEVVSRGYYVSVGPAILYSKKIGRVARAVPVENLLAESDGPVPYRALGGVSGPSLIPSVLLALAEAKGQAYDGIEEKLERNAKRFLGVERLI